VIKFKCPHCDRDVSVGDEHAGKKARCPACREIFQIPQAGAVSRPRAPSPPPREEAEEEIPAPRPRPKAPPPARPRRPEPVEEEEEIPEVEAVDDEPEEEEEEERPRRKKKKRRRGEWADCPNCNARGDASRVWYTWWGAWLGPLIICHVRCNRCGTAYNGKSGEYNTAAIAVYVIVTTVIALGVVILAVIAESMK
jgi:uncharacterized paraquat-inducible protein A